MSAFDYSKYLELAIHLNSLKSEEANRSGISRCYYSIFSYAKNFCIEQALIRERDIKSYNTSLHQKIINLLKESDVEELSEIGGLIDTLRYRRNDADYDPFCKESSKKSLLDDSIRLTNTIRQKISEY